MTHTVIPADLSTWELETGGSPQAWCKPSYIVNFRLAEGLCLVHIIETKQKETVWVCTERVCVCVLLMFDFFIFLKTGSDYIG